MKEYLEYMDHAFLWLKQVYKSDSYMQKRPDLKLL